MRQSLSPLAFVFERLLKVSLQALSDVEGHGRTQGAHAVAPAVGRGGARPLLDDYTIGWVLAERIYSRAFLAYSVAWLKAQAL